eukprot:233836-Chlamydomonas_euryale.AAC.1
MRRDVARGTAGSWLRKPFPAPCVRPPRFSPRGHEWQRPFVRRRPFVNAACQARCCSHRPLAEEAESTTPSLATVKCTGANKQIGLGRRRRAASATRGCVAAPPAAGPGHGDNRGESHRLQHLPDGGGARLWGPSGTCLMAVGPGCGDHRGGSHGLQHLPDGGGARLLGPSG